MKETVIEFEEKHSLFSNSRVRRILVAEKIGMSEWRVRPMVDDERGSYYIDSSQDVFYFEGNKNELKKELKQHGWRVSRT